MLCAQFILCRQSARCATGGLYPQISDIGNQTRSCSWSIGKHRQRLAPNGWRIGTGSLFVPHAEVGLIPESLWHETTLVADSVCVVSIQRLPFHTMLYELLPALQDGSQFRCSESERIFSQKKASSGMLRRVALVRTDVSEESSASIIRVTIICELGT
jgi:hypothetical protein